MGKLQIIIAVTSAWVFLAPFARAQGDASASDHHSASASAVGPDASLNDLLGTTPTTKDAVTSGHDMAVGTHAVDNGAAVATRMSASAPMSGPVIAESNPSAASRKSRKAAMSKLTEHAGNASTTGADKDKMAGNPIIEEIVVTAEKREENIQNVPIAISAYSAGSLAARGATNVKDVAVIAPAVTLSGFGGFTFIYIRGIGSDAFIPSADPSVTTYVDGIFVPSSQGFSTDFGDIKRVEVLKGPQGTLFGRNSTGGAINVITKKPSRDGYEGAVEGGLGNYNTRRLKGYVSGPITDTLSASMDLLYNYQHPPYTFASLPSGVTPGTTPTKDLSGRFRIDWHPTDYFDADFSYLRSSQESSDGLVSKNIQPSLLFAAVLPKQADDFVATDDFNPFLHGGNFVYALNTSLELPWLNVKFIGSHQKTESSYSSIDFDGTGVPLVDFYTRGEFQKATTAELQFTSNAGGWGGSNLDWVTGVYYLTGTGGFKQIHLQPAHDLLDVVANNLALPQNLLDTLSPVLTPLGNAVNADLLAAGVVKINSISGYGQGTYHFADWDLPWLALQLGGRYTSERRYLEYSYTNAYVPATGTTVPLFNFPHVSTPDTNFSTRISINVTPAAGQLIYLSRSQGFKSGTYNVINIDQPPNYVLPSLVTTYELGMKSTSFDGLLKFNAAVFDNIIKNKQTLFVSLLSGGAISLGNAQRTQVLGAEFELTAVPLPDLDPGFVVTLNGSYLHGKFEKYTGAKGYDPATGIFAGNEDLSGNVVDRTPKFLGDLGLSQSFEAGTIGQVELAADLHYTSSFFFSPDDDPAVAQGAYALLNAHASYLYRPWNVKITGYGKNILGRRNHEGKFRTDFGILSELNYLAVYGVTLDWTF